MHQNIDSAILKALSLKVDTASISSHGGSGFSSTYKIVSKDQDGKDKLYFVKTGKGRDSEVMFAGELDFAHSCALLRNCLVLAIIDLLY